MDANNTLTRFVSSVLGGAESNLTGIGDIVINLAEDLSKTLDVIFYVSAALGIYLFVLTFVHIKKRKSNPNSRVDGFSVGLKLISSALMGQLASFVYNLSQSFSDMANPMYPNSYVAKAREVQGSDPMFAMVLGVLAIFTLLGWIYALKSLYMFYFAGNKEDVEQHLMKAFYTCLGSIIIVNASFFAMSFVDSATNGAVTSIGG